MPASLLFVGYRTAVVVCPTFGARLGDVDADRLGLQA